jgi:hypothetical protein
MSSRLEQAYIKYNFPSAQKLYRIMKDSLKEAYTPPEGGYDGANVTLKGVQEFLSQKKEHQMLKVKQKPKKEGHITAMFEGQNAQLDIFDLSKYKSQNSNYKYLLVVIDVFTRKAYITAMKNKDAESVLNAFKSMTPNYKPNFITSDTDRSFMSRSFQEYLTQKNILHQTVIASNDHNALGIIDRFTRTLKTVLNKMFIVNDNVNWTTHINQIIERYNNSPQSPLENLTPVQAAKFENQNLIATINKAKIDNKPPKSEFKEGDIVRVRIDKTFRKGTDPRYSDETYVISTIQGKRMTLNNGKIKLESALMKVDGHDNAPLPQTKVTTENRIKRTLNREGIDTSNIISSKRR